MRLLRKPDTWKILKITRAMKGRQERQVRFQDESSLLEDRYNSGQEVSEEYPVKFSPKLKNLHGPFACPFRSATNEEKGGL